MKKSLTLFVGFLLSLSILSGCNNPEPTVQEYSPESLAKAETNVSDVQTKQSTTSKEESLTLPNENIHGTIRSHHIDVGQADCAFLELPNGKTMLIDAGNSKDGKNVVSYINNLNHQKIDYVVGTHPHADHIGGMATVLNSFEIGAVYIPEKSHTSKVFENMLDAIENNQIPLIPAKSGVSIFQEGDLQADILAPIGNSYSNINEWSVVVKVSYGKTEFLYTGDATTRNENELLSSGAVVQADVLKVGHHGSDTSTSSQFVRAVSPKYAVISCGANNQYGHPDNSTVVLLQNLGINIYRTDEVGTVIITADNQENISIDKKASSVKENAPPSQIANVDEVYERPSTNEKKSEVVYRTKTGKKYHVDGCSYLKSRIETTVADAVAMGLTPCSRCHPPQ